MAAFRWASCRRSAFQIHKTAMTRPIESAFRRQPKVTDMKIHRHTVFAILLVGLSLVGAAGAAAQTVVRVAGPTVIGTVSEFHPDTIVIRSGTAAEPVRYYYTKNTTYVDESGFPVTVESVRYGTPVTVFYTRNGKRNLVSKVVVRTPVIETKTTTTTTRTTQE
jgi:hypothetical protein